MTSESSCTPGQATWEKIPNILAFDVAISPKDGAFAWVSAKQGDCGLTSDEDFKIYVRKGGIDDLKADWIGSGVRVDIYD